MSDWLEIAKHATDLISHYASKRAFSIRDVRERVEEHLQFAEKWSSKVQNYTTPRLSRTESATVALQIDSVPKRFKGTSSFTNETILESSLATTDESYLILGLPGAGKTTTLKRVVRRILSYRGSQITTQFPLIIILRQLEPGETLLTRIANTLGISYKIDLERAKIEADTKTLFDPTNIFPDQGPPLTDRDVWETTINIDHLLLAGKNSLATVISEILDDLNVVILIDGIDEIPSLQRTRVWGGISLIVSKFTKARVLTTCRTGDFTKDMPGVVAVELMPLDDLQIEEISGKFLDSPQEFLSVWQALPYQDLARRPLFLTYLLTIFKNEGELPKEPKNIYRQIITLTLREWDHQNDIRRISKYGGFDADNKIEFLSCLSYELTYSEQSRRFSGETMSRAYRKVCKKFNLPESEHAQVVAELETHTGLIANSGFDGFEFTHLSLQEYLCANYLVRAPFADYYRQYLSDFPGPIAVAVCLSSDPSQWFAAVILGHYNTNFDPKSTQSLLSRLVQERPSFTTDKDLGFALLRILFATAYPAGRYIAELMHLNNVCESLLEALQFYHINENRDGSYALLLHSIEKTKSGFFLQRSGTLDQFILQKLAAISGAVIKKANGKIVPNN